MDLELDQHRKLCDRFYEGLCRHPEFVGTIAYEFLTKQIDALSGGIVDVDSCMCVSCVLNFFMCLFSVALRSFVWSRKLIDMLCDLEHSYGKGAVAIMRGRVR